MNIRIVSFLFYFIITMSINLNTLRTQNGLYQSYDVQVVRTSTRQFLKLPNSRTVQLLTIPDGYSFYSYSSGQCCLQSLFNYYQFPTSPKPYKQDFFYNDADLDYNNFTTPAKLVQQAKLKLDKQPSQTQKNAFQITIQQNLRNSDIQSLIDSQIPVILLINRGKSQKSAAYVIAIGYDQENYYFEDPYTIRTITYLPKNTLGNIWNTYIQSENRWVNHLGIVVKFQNGRKREIVPTVRPLP